MGRRNGKKPLEGRQLYFAFGSNLVARQMRERCPSSRPVSRARLDGWRIAFGGHSGSWDGAVADVVREAGAWVDGVLYELSAADVYALDAFEGHPYAYLRRQLAVATPRGRRVKAFVYAQTGLAMFTSRVSRVYYKRMYDAYRRLGFNVSPLARARLEHDREVDDLIAEDTHRVFVYGSLLRGEGNDGFLRGSYLVGKARTAPGFELFDLGAYPGMVARGTTGQVAGEVYEVDTLTLASLDRLEGHPRFYRRTTIRLEDGDVVETYLLQDHHVADRERVATGNWRRRERRGGEEVRLVH